MKCNYCNNVWDTLHSFDGYTSCHALNDGSIITDHKSATYCEDCLRFMQWLELCCKYELLSLTETKDEDIIMMILQEMRDFDGEVGIFEEEHDRYRLVHGDIMRNCSSAIGGIIPKSLIGCTWAEWDEFLKTAECCEIPDEVEYFAPLPQSPIPSVSCYFVRDPKTDIYYAIQFSC